MQVLKQEKVDYIVAPYEADAQMTFLSVNKLVDAVITEDSDLIPFGCSRVSTLLQPPPQPSTYTITFLFTSTMPVRCYETIKYEELGHWLRKLLMLFCSLCAQFMIKKSKNT